MSHEKRPDIVQFIQQRNSAAKLTEPAPDASELNEIIKAALRAPDHARLTPARFIIVEGDARKSLAKLFVETASSQSTEAISEEKKQSLLAMPMRAPMIIVAVATICEHPKVPEVEQLLSVGCSVQNILLSLDALGYNAIWRTGDMAYSAVVHQGLGLDAHQKIVGFVYTGTLQGKEKKLPVVDVDAIIKYWR